MGTSYNANIVTDGLVLCLDAANPRSYPGSGTSWYDLSGNGNHVTLYNSVSYSNGTLSGDATSAYGRTTNTLNLSGLTGITVVSMLKTITRGMAYEHTANWNTNNSYSGISYGGFGFATNSNGTAETTNINHVQLKGNVFYSGTNATTPDYSKFQHYTVTHNFSASSDETHVYTNNTLTGKSSLVIGGGTLYNSNNTGTFVNDYLYFWSRGGTTSYGNIPISLLMIYGRVLSIQEIRQNYNSNRGRYGI